MLISLDEEPSNQWESLNTPIDIALEGRHLCSHRLHRKDALSELDQRAQLIRERLQIQIRDPYRGSGRIEAEDKPQAFSDEKVLKRYAFRGSVRIVSVPAHGKEQLIER